MGYNLIYFPDLDGYDYFFSAIEIPNGEDKVSINIQNNYNNTELEPFGTYLFIYEIDEEGTPNWVKWMSIWDKIITVT